SQKGALSTEKGGIFIGSKWIQIWAPNLNFLSFPVLACQRRCYCLCQSSRLTQQGRCHRPSQAVLPPQSDDRGGATALARRCHRPRLGGS
ncbi:unnamed protein product, partial [Musa textilis]